ncbi:DUF5698 domain-containing protein [Loigolactobacillus coryniformis]|jgi:uncharacterized protein YebE (UPF0316 family)|uniref:UPF0316 protein A11Y_130822 n=2 Tax=Loigolactobacillus coryniformis subsp. coryniformis TaxID=115541 RepID=J3ERK7_9LACO|nr:DUF5698 domain-containing protein [Loigolactobacillus coryniformis]MDT3391170.1 DUF5698 domain-containing protein [Bacillota bacterium]RRG05319.1 MAG: DUF2179 domain-containing protein [Lactobacillus sp.]ATO54191.1 hypothetical protein LC20001_00490 [Loigolactobacillus coryniformis subsp. coryniformis KCTC 3167 = DSM 20001]EJN56300.1 UPF0316 protein [Loigolactobacillus coryniformis subsp. coryniformis CECT 5711]KRK15992.1 hypothetical protein FD22_GL001406 [Loigolactobacillus coryniformis s
MHINIGFIFLVFGINVLYLTINTLRLIFQNKGLIWVAPFFGMVEITLYTMGLNYVLNSLANPLYLVAYALGFGLGIGLGMLIDRWLAIGYVIVQIIIPQGEENQDKKTLVHLLRDAGYGVTEFDGIGRDGARMVLEVLVPRKDEKTIYDMVLAFNPRAFMLSLEPTTFNGGFWVKRLKRRRQLIAQRDRKNK